MLGNLHTGNCLHFLAVEKKGELITMAKENLIDQLVLN